MIYKYYGCGSLTSVTIGNGVTNIGEYAFSNCNSLSSLTIPKSVTSIGEDAFRGCSGLNSIVVETGNTVYDSPDNCNAIIETATNTLIVGCKNSVITNSVTTIGKDAFYGCSGLSSLSIPENVTIIGDGAFRECSGLSSVTIPESVTSIGSNAFRSCSGLTSATIPNSVTNIGDWAFSYCRAMTSVTIPNSVTSIGEDAFYNCSGLTSVTIPNSVASIGEDAFYNCSGLTSLTIGNGVTSIGGEAFKGCSGLTSVTIPESVTSIGKGAFSECSGLSSIKVESGNNIYDSRDNCNAIIETATNTLICGCQNTIIPNSVTSIGDEAFFGCSGLTSVTIPNSVESIGEYAFYGCDKLSKIFCNPEEAPSTTSSTFSESTIAISLLLVPKASINKYATSTHWSGFVKIVAFNYTLTYLVDNQEYKTFEIEYDAPITAEDDLTKEGYTFSGWKNLPIKMPADDVTVTGSFTINQYKLTYKVDDDEYKSFDVEYDSAITPEAAPTKEGYTFSGWSEIPATMPAGDVTITGSFIPKKYMLTYIVDGETYKTFEIDCGAILSIEPEPIKEGYLFSGWSEIPKTMPARNLSIMGTFTISDDIQGVNADEGEYQIYTLEGKQVENLQKGVNIIRYSDGTSKKIYVK